MQHWRGFTGIFCLQTAPVLEFAHDTHPADHDCRPRS